MESYKSKIKNKRKNNNRRGRWYFLNFHIIKIAFIFINFIRNIVWRSLRRIIIDFFWRNSPRQFLLSFQYIFIVAMNKSGGKGDKKTTKCDYHMRSLRPH
jgi:hypothetical protein